MLAMTHLMDQRRNCSVAKLGHCSLQLRTEASEYVPRRPVLHAPARRGDRMKRRKIIGYVVSFVEQTLAQGVLARGWCVRRTIPQQHAAMIN
jgi:hypothetical protein